ncbi:hypothetical protein [Limnobacter sp. CACIAM 66H1]|uniref:hypothetical protein n=1 Tax=Limnobacter sp. CACIAM 66H1 TaxID=1813033 RepID=UPI0025BAEB0C|nr:hypothetical protein [Limnobacter sp. CACIAM 66H1]
MQNADLSVIYYIKPWAEILYLLSGTGIFILACFGLRQLTLAKQQLETSKDIFKTQSKRASFESSAHQCNEYSKNITQLYHKLTKFAKENSITFFADAKIEEKENGIRVNISDVNKEHIEKLEEISDIVSAFINGIEGFSVYIISGIADEDTAFHTVGKVYVKHAEMVAKLTTFTNSTQEDNKQIWALYFKWKKRLENQRLETERKKIEEKINKNQTKPIRAIGT